MCSKQVITWLCAVTVFFAAVGVDAGIVLFDHTGGNDPATEGWTVTGDGVDATFGSINDGGTPAWFVDDNSASGGLRSYSRVPTAQNHSDAATLGWKLSLRLRVPDFNDAADSAVHAEYANGTTRNTMTFGSDADGDPVVILATGVSNGEFTGPTFTSEGTGSTYHLYELIFDPLVGSADLFVDGTERISDYSGITGTLDRVSWGAAGTPSLGQGNYNSVQFTVVPEPSAGFYVAQVGGLVFCLQRGRRRWRGSTTIST